MSEGVESAQLLQAIQQEEKELTSELPFAAYLERARADPRLTRLSHELIHDMIVSAGVTRGRGGLSRYSFFRDELFGVDAAISQVAEYFGAAARRLEVRKRILLLVGPPGCGKSTLVDALKRGLENYSRTPEGAVYAIKDCPVYEDPLHLLPRHRRRELPGLRIEGDLCPYCRWLVRNVYHGDVGRVPVQRFSFSASEGIGIGTFVATDPNSEDLTRLVGEVDLALLRGSVDRRAARQAYRLDGELNAANRGLADLIEILKMDERFLSVLLSVSQEQLIKLSGRGVMYADEALVAHSNLAEYEALVADPKSSALQDRLVVVRMGYALSVRDETRIYQKLLGKELGDGAHLSPLALRVAATFAILTRLGPPRSGWTLPKKLRFYDGRFVPDVRPEDLRAEAREDGSFGFSPRYVINQLSRALGRSRGCLSGMAILETLWDGLTQRAGFSEEDRESASDLFALARKEYDEMVKRTLARAAAPGFEEAASALAREALRELRAWSAGAGDGRLERLPELERALGVPQYLQHEFRGDVLAALAAGDVPLHRADPRLEEAIEKVLLPSWRDVTKWLLAEESTSEGLEKRTELRRRLIDEADFCRECADDLLEYGVHLARPGRDRRGGPRVLRWRG